MSDDPRQIIFENAVISVGYCGEGPLLIETETPEGLTLVGALEIGVSCTETAFNQAVVIVSNGNAGLPYVQINALGEEFSSPIVRRYRQGYIEVPVHCIQRGTQIRCIWPAT